MIIRSFTKNIPLFSPLVLYIYHKVKNRHLVRFPYSARLSSQCEFEGLNKVDSHASFYGRMGLGSYIGRDTCLNADIGRFSSIGPYVKVINATHPFKTPFATTCPLFYSLDKGKNPERTTFARRQMVEEFRYYDSDREIDVKIGNDCWIGEGVVMIGGVEVHDGAVVLAHAVVTKDVPPYAIVGGIPAKVVGYRYDEDTISFLMRIKWWNRDKTWLRDNWELLCDIEKMKSYFLEQDE